MEQLHNGYTLELCDGAFPLSTDSVALAGFAKLPKNATILDLGSGCGTLGLLLCAKDPTCQVTGIELEENAHRTALQNATENKISERLTSICADIQNISTLVAGGSFHCCISNPPYFSAGPKSKTLATARRDDFCSMDTLMRAAAWGLKFGGDFFLVHRPERMAELFTSATKYNMEPKRLQLLRHRSDGPIALILVQCRKGAKPGLIIEEESLYHSDGSHTDCYRALYHIQEA